MYISGPSFVCFLKFCLIDLISLGRQTQMRKKKQKEKNNKKKRRLKTKPEIPI